MFHTLVMTLRAQRRVSSMIEGIRCCVRGWIERNVIAEFPAFEDLP